MTFQVAADAVRPFHGPVLRAARARARRFRGDRGRRPCARRRLRAGCADRRARRAARCGGGVGGRSVGALRRSSPRAAARCRRTARGGRGAAVRGRFFDAALAQLVVHFMADPVAGLREMARVTRGGGVVAACVWDHGGGRGPLSPFWEAAHELDPDVGDESKLAGAREGHLLELFAVRRARRGRGRPALGRRRASDLRGLVGAVHARRRPGRRICDRARRRPANALRELCRERLPAAPFVVSAGAWVAGAASSRLRLRSWHGDRAAPAVADR